MSIVLESAHFDLVDIAARALEQHNARTQKGR